MDRGIGPAAPQLAPLYTILDVLDVSSLVRVF